MRMLYHSRSAEQSAASAWRVVLEWRKAQITIAPYIEASKKKIPANQLNLFLWTFERLKRQMERAQNEIVALHMPSVVQLCRRYNGPNIEQDELLQTGRLALVRAIHKFDPTKGLSFWQYAGQWVFSDVRRVVDQSQRPVSVPSSARIIVKAAEAKQREIQVRQGRNASQEESFAALGIDISKREYAFLAAQDVSLDAEMEGGETLHGLLAAQESEQEIDPLESRQLHLALTRLKPRDREVMVSIFGLKDGIAKTLEVVGAEIGVTRERVRQIVVKSLEKLRAILTPKLATA